MENFIGTYKNSLSSENCQRIIEWFEKTPHRHHEGEFHSAGGGNKKIINKDVKDSIDIALDFEDDSWVTNTILSSIQDGLEKYKSKYTQLDNCLPVWGLTKSYNLQRYLPGGGYKNLHCENQQKDNGRVMAWMIYLNTVEDKGGTYFSSYDLTEKAEEGKLLIWPAYWTHTHKGIPSPTESKYIATGWFEFA